MPDWRPNSVRYSSHTPSIATAATPSTSQRDGSGARLSAKYRRQPYRHSVSSVSHHGARSACGAITSTSEAMSHARSRAVTWRSSGRQRMRRHFSAS